MERRGFMAALLGASATTAVAGALSGVGERALSGPEDPGTVHLFWCGDHFETIAEGGDLPKHFHGHLERLWLVPMATCVGVHRFGLGFRSFEHGWYGGYIQYEQYPATPPERGSMGRRFQNRRAAEEWLVAQGDGPDTA